MQVAKVDLKSMEFKKRVEYIWDYYKVHIIGTLAIIFFIGSFVYGQVTKIDCAFNVTFTVNALYDENIVKLGEELTSLVVDPSEKRLEATVSVLPVSSSTGVDAMSNMQMMQKFTVQVAAGEIDVLIIDKSDVDGMSQQGLLLGLDAVSGLDINENLVIKDSNGENYGISLENSNKLKEMNINTENMVLAICGSSKKLEMIPRVIQWFLN